MPKKAREKVRLMHAEGKGLDEIGKHIDARRLDRDAAAGVWLYAWRLGRGGRCRPSVSDVPDGLPQAKA